MSFKGHVPEPNTGLSIRHHHNTNNNKPARTNHANNKPVVTNNKTTINNRPVSPPPPPPPMSPKNNNSNNYPGRSLSPTPVSPSKFHHNNHTNPISPSKPTPKSFATTTNNNNNKITSPTQTKSNNTAGVAERKTMLTTQASNQIVNKSERRAAEAQDWVEKSIQALITQIKQLGGVTTFGVLFNKLDSETDSLVGILARAKKRNLVKYNAVGGFLLIIGQDDNVKIELVN
jgi:hypothetical protein